MRVWPCFLVIALGFAEFTPLQASDTQTIEAGIAARNITPRGPIWLAGYAARNKPSEQVDSPLMVQAVALRSPPGDPVVLVSIDNCEVSRELTGPVIQSLAAKHGLGPGRVMIVSSHTHSAPVVHGPLHGMYFLSSTNAEAVAEYGCFLQTQLTEVVGAALQDLRPAQLEHGTGQTRFAINRRVVLADRVVIGENFDGPVDWDVPVLSIRGATNDLRGIVFGYACHGTSVAGEDFYTVCGDYMAYARQQLEAVYPGAVTAFLTGMGADSNPYPRGRLLNAKRHGLELAGAVSSVLGRPMRSVRGQLRFAYAELELPLVPHPPREQLEADAQNKDVYIQQRAKAYLEKLNRGETPADSVQLPMSVLRLGDDLTFCAIGGEVVVDYAIRLKRLLAADHPWCIGYAYEVPCYIPSIHILKEGGYEPDSSLIYYGLYGPFQTKIEDLIVSKMTELARSARGQ
ncbi:MAG: neutral/alkaline non-lysosomal ceramidase N-terminal domain-containing protein [Verrucomicrobiota bacterium]